MLVQGNAGNLHFGYTMSSVRAYLHWTVQLIKFPSKLNAIFLPRVFPSNNSIFTNDFIVAGE